MLNIDSLITLKTYYGFHIIEGKGKGAMLHWRLGGVLISLSQAIEPVGGYTTKSVMLGQCDARPTVTFPATEHHRPLADTNILLGEQRHMCVNNLPRVVTRGTVWNSIV